MVGIVEAGKTVGDDLGGRLRCCLSGLLVGELFCCCGLCLGRCGPHGKIMLGGKR
jgi:hypothetical protein